MSRPPLGSTLDVLGISIPFYSLLMMLAVMIGFFLSSKEGKRLKLPEDALLNYALLAIPLGIIGARLYYVLFQWDAYRRQPLEILRIWNGGLAIYGAILGGVAAALILTRKRRGDLLKLLDALAPSLALGQAIGRWGNYANMEAYGSPVSNPAFQFFPIAVEIQVDGQWVWHIASFFYESVCCFLIFLFLWNMRSRFQKSGDAVLWYMLLYGVCRTFTESLRTDSLTFGLLGMNVRVSQALSALACLTAACVFLVRCPSKRPLGSFALIPLGLLAMLLAGEDLNFPEVSALLLAACCALSLVSLFISRSFRLSPLVFTLPGGVLALLVLLIPIPSPLLSILLQAAALLLILPAAWAVYNAHRT